MLTVLLVEDEDSVRNLARRILTRAGYEVIEADDASSALELWHRHRERVDLLLTDMVMPGGMTGMELARRVLAQDPRTPIVITSGYTFDLLGTADAVTFLRKPYLPVELLETVRQVLDKS